MSSPGFNATLELNPKASVFAVQVVVALHVLAIALIFLAQPAHLPGVALALAIFVSWLSLRRPRAAGYGSGALCRLIWHANSERWRIETVSGRIEDATLQRNSIVLPWLVILNFKTLAGARRTRMLLGDEIDPDQLRRLRARLLLLRQTGGDGTSRDV